MAFSSDISTPRMLSLFTIYYIQLFEIPSYLIICLIHMLSKSKATPVRSYQMAYGLNQSYNILEEKSLYVIITGGTLLKFQLMEK